MVAEIAIGPTLRANATSAYAPRTVRTSCQTWTDGASGTSRATRAYSSVVFDALVVPWSFGKR